MVARLKLKGIDGRAPPGAIPAENPPRGRPQLRRRGPQLPATEGERNLVFRKVQREEGIWGGTGERVAAAGEGEGERD